MIDMIVEEGGKLYNINEKTGLVTEASLAEEIRDEYRLNDRVVVLGSAGSIVSMVPSYYGVAFGVQFDNGDFDEFVESQLERTAAEVKTYESPILEVFDRYASYLEMPAYTEDELERKEIEARWLRLNAQTLRERILSGSGGKQDPKLDEIIVTTTTDLNELKEVRESTETTRNQQYLSSAPKYTLHTGDTVGAGLGGTDDASWLGISAEDYEVVDTTDTDLATRATEIVSTMTREQLEDEEFMRVASSYQHEYLKLTPEQITAFNNYLVEARQSRLKELPTEVKTASTEFNLDDASDIFL